MLSNNKSHNLINFIVEKYYQFLTPVWILDLALEIVKITNNQSGIAIFN